jgi:hypothetical protein
VVNYLKQVLENKISKLEYITSELSTVLEKDGKEFEEAIKEGTILEEKIVNEGKEEDDDETSSQEMPDFDFQVTLSPEDDMDIAETFDDNVEENLQTTIRSKPTKNAKDFASNTDSSKEKISKATDVVVILDDDEIEEDGIKSVEERRDNVILDQEFDSDDEKEKVIIYLLILILQLLKHFLSS